MVNSTTISCKRAAIVNRSQLNKSLINYNIISNTNQSNKLSNKETNSKKISSISKLKTLASTKKTTIIKDRYKYSSLDSLAILGKKKKINNSELRNYKFLLPDTNVVFNDYFSRVKVKYIVKALFILLNRNIEIANNYYEILKLFASRKYVEIKEAKKSKITKKNKLNKNKDKLKSDYNNDLRIIDIEDLEKINNILFNYKKINTHSNIKIKIIVKDKKIANITKNIENVDNLELNKEINNLQNNNLHNNKNSCDIIHDINTDFKDDNFINCNSSQYIANNIYHNYGSTKIENNYNDNFEELYSEKTNNNKHLSKKLIIDNDIEYSNLNTNKNNLKNKSCNNISIDNCLKFNIKETISKNFYYNSLYHNNLIIIQDYINLLDANTTNISGCINKRLINNNKSYTDYNFQLFKNILDINQNIIYLDKKVLYDKQYINNNCSNGNENYMDYTDNYNCNSDNTVEYNTLELNEKHTSTRSLTSYKIKQMLLNKNKEYEISVKAYISERFNLILIFNKNINLFKTFKTYNLNICKFLNRNLNESNSNALSQGDRLYDNVCNINSYSHNYNEKDILLKTFNSKNTQLKSKLQKCRISRTFYNFILYTQENKRSINLSQTALFSNNINFKLIKNI